MVPVRTRAIFCLAPAIGCCALQSYPTISPCVNVLTERSSCRPLLPFNKDAIAHTETHPKTHTHSCTFIHDGERDHEMDQYMPHKGTERKHAAKVIIPRTIHTQIPLPPHRLVRMCPMPITNQSVCDGLYRR